MRRYRVRLTGSAFQQLLLLMVMIVTFLTVVLIPIGMVALMLNLEVYEV